MPDQRMKREEEKVEGKRLFFVNGLKTKVAHLSKGRGSLREGMNFLGFEDIDTRLARFDRKGGGE